MTCFVSYTSIYRDYGRIQEIYDKMSGFYGFFADVKIFIELLLFIK